MHFSGVASGMVGLPGMEMGWIGLRAKGGSYGLCTKTGVD